MKSAITFTLMLVMPMLAWSGELAGLWQAYDDHTGNIEALIRIEKLADNSYEGSIEKVFPDAENKTALICSSCTGSLHNQPLIGMRILSGMKGKDKLNFEGGEILDPDEGKIYGSSVKCVGKFWFG